MATKKKEPVLIPGELYGKRQARKLSCSLCPRSVVVSVYPDPEYGEGWPRHRCGHDVRPFDRSEVQFSAL